MKNIFVILLVLAGQLGFAQIQKNNKSKLTIEQIMQNPDQWVGTSPDNIYWAENGKHIYFDWNPDHDTLETLYSYSLKSKQVTKVLLSEKQKLPAKNGSYNRAKTKKVYARNGNLFLYDIKKEKEIQLTDWLERVSSPQFVLNDTKISFLKNNNLYLYDIETRVISQLTNFVSGNKTKDSKPDAQSAWLQNQQKELFKVLNRREAVKRARENRNKAEEITQPEKIYLGKKQLSDVSLSPQGNYVVYSTWQRPSGVKSTSVTHLVTNSGYTEEQRSRPKVGATQSKVEMAIFDVANNKTIDIDISNLPGLTDVPDFYADYPNKYKDISETKRDINLFGPVWNPAEEVAIIVALSADHKDRWILLLHPENGSLELLDRQRDEAWIGGPGIGSWGFSTGAIGWLPDNETVWFQSEKTGYSHLYTINTKTKKTTQLTNGNYEVSDAFLSADKKYFYFTANKIHPGVKHFYKMPVEGGEPVQITSLEGGNEVVLSPNEKYLAIRHSTANHPWELYIQENKKGAESVAITHSTTPEFDKYHWRVPEYITFKARDGESVYARLYQPKKPANSRPAVIFVHGAGYLQNAHKWWSSYFREYQFHNFLADNGYTVLDIDYRGSAGYGRDWRTGIYRNMGGKDLSDQVDGAKMLVQKYDVSEQKIGIYGGSYGGFITLMAMFKTPGVFAAGAALRSVTDWAHYNHGYTANILNTPVEDSLAFVRSSPIYYAEGLKGALLMCHGMVDDNVQFQDIVRLSQRLIELGKENWELAAYPVERHGFVEPLSWTDEYKRIFKLFEENLK